MAVKAGRLFGGAASDVVRVRPGRRVAGAIALVLPIVVVLTAGFGIIAIRQRADDRREAQVMLSRISASANRQRVLESNALELGLVAEGRPNATLARELRSLPDELARLDDEVAQALTRLRAAEPGSTELDDLAVAVNRYQVSLEAQSALLTAGRFDESFGYHRSRVDLAYRNVSQELAQQDARFDALTQDASRMADFGTLGILGFALVLLAFLQFDRARRAAAVDEAQRKVLSESEARFRSLVQNSRDVICIIDERGRALYASPAVAEVFGITPEQVCGEDLLLLAHPDERKRVRGSLAELAAEPRGASSKLECRVRHDDGSFKDLEVTATNLLDDAYVGGIVLNARDISERKVAERDNEALQEQLAHQAFHDPLTGLANRALLRERLQHALARVARSRAPLADMFIDLDEFKAVNDSMGHDVGDELLKAVAGRLGESVRPADTIARLGGDEFAILLEGMFSAAEAPRVAERIIRTFTAPFDLGGHPVTIGASIGLALKDGKEGTEELLGNADVAMYAAKARGRGCYEVYRPELRLARTQRIRQELDLQTAVTRNEFVVHYQPIVDMATGCMSGAEALLRWAHPTKGLIPPMDFVELAEETGLIVPLGRWILREACRNGAAWKKTHPEAAEMKVSVNLSVRQFQETDLVQQVADTLEVTRFPASDLVLEITESVFLNDSPATLAAIQGLKDLGVTIAIDDFGTGYSSLSYLRSFPIDMLKIDRSFIDGIDRGVEDAALARAIVQIGENLNLRIVAEGIETPEQLREVRRLGCHEGQGFFLGTPLDHDELKALLARGATRTNWLDDAPLEAVT
ncbi:MAG TPA: EAL domain-containing protein [Actinomycetota bacterium]|nr:EAL domain-containing protein [Actinomycetota bacterium]